MSKNLKARAIGTVILSGALFALPVGAFLANQTTTTPVFAMEKEKEDTQEKENVSGNEDDANNVDETESTEETYIDPNVVISITAPEGWANDTAKVAVSATDALETGNFKIVKIEAKIGQNGTWTDITEDKYIEISENCSVYVQVTDQEDNVYEKNRSIKCFDTTNPTLNAAVSNGLLSIVGYDNDSGIKAFYVNGYEFTEFTNSTLNIRLQQFDTGYEYFTVQAMDNAGNMSEVYKTSNPYYDDDTTDDDDKGASTLPTDVTATSPTSATATVTEHTNTDSNGNTVSTTSQSTGSNSGTSAKQASETSDSNAGESDSEESGTGKEFYTIQTESEKVFYLIIDRNGDEETVYFLTEISENDLLNTTSDNSETLPKNSAALESAIPTGESALSNNNTETGENASTDVSKEEEDSTEETDTETSEEAETAEENAQSGAGLYVILAILAAGSIGAWYYLKMVKGKKEAALDEDEDDEKGGEEDAEEIYETDDEGRDGDEYFDMDDENNDEDTTEEE